MVKTKCQISLSGPKRRSYKCRISPTTDPPRTTDPPTVNADPPTHRPPTTDPPTPDPHARDAFLGFRLDVVDICVRIKVVDI
eukprot:9085059-Pyramimonas_sp.AAC.1